MTKTLRSQLTHRGVTLDCQYELHGRHLSPSDIDDGETPYVDGLTVSVADVDITALMSDAVLQEIEALLEEPYQAAPYEPSYGSDHYEPTYTEGCLMRRQAGGE